MASSLNHHHHKPLAMLSENYVSYAIYYAAVHIAMMDICQLHRTCQQLCVNLHASLWSYEIDLWLRLLGPCMVYTVINSRDPAAPCCWWCSSTHYTKNRILCIWDDSVITSLWCLQLQKFNRNMIGTNMKCISISWQNYCYDKVTYSCSVKDHEDIFGWYI